MRKKTKRAKRVNNPYNKIYYFSESKMNIYLQIRYIQLDVAYPSGMKAHLFI